jgi:succinoglycan biosynthesis protein ExoM
LTSRPHIAVCICTYKRPDLLKRLLTELSKQDTQALFTFSIVVADNDAQESARPVVSEFALNATVPIQYCVQPKQNISLTRNKAIESAEGDFIAFIDDDEFPVNDWLLQLYRACLKYNVDGALGPVKPHFDVQPPAWVVKGGFHDRATYPTGFIIDWPKGRTGNLLFKKSVLEGVDEPFRSDFITGEDQDFFRRMIERGHKFVWCDEALAYETVPPIRWSRRFMLKRALLRGKVSLRHPTTKTRDTLKSFLAVPLYLAALPVLFLAGQHLFMQYLIKSFDHLGRILAFIGIDPVGEKYVTE